MTNEEHTLKTPAGPANNTESPDSVTPSPPSRLRKLQPTAIEAVQPGKAVDFMIQSAEDPLASVSSKARAAGMPYEAALGLEQRLRTRYAETMSEVVPVTKEALEKRLSRRLEIISEWLTDERFKGMLDDAKLKDFGIYEGIMLTKLAELRGQPSIIIRTEDAVKLDQVGAAILEELTRRGVGSVELSERKVKANLDNGSPHLPR